MTALDDRAPEPPEWDDLMTEIERLKADEVFMAQVRSVHERNRGALEKLADM